MSDDRFLAALERMATDATFAARVRGGDAAAVAGLTAEECARLRALEDDSEAASSVLPNRLSKSALVGGGMMLQQTAAMSAAADAAQFHVDPGVLAAVEGAQQHADPVAGADVAHLAALPTATDPSTLLHADSPAALHVPADTSGFALDAHTQLPVDPATHLLISADGRFVDPATLHLLGADGQPTAEVWHVPASTTAVITTTQVPVDHPALVTPPVVDVAHTLPPPGDVAHPLPPATDPAHALPPAADAAHALPPAADPAHALPPAVDVAHALPPASDVAHAIPPAAAAVSLLHPDGDPAITAHVPGGMHTLVPAVDDDSPLHAATAQHAAMSPAMYGALSQPTDASPHLAWQLPPSLSEPPDVSELQTVYHADGSLVTDYSNGDELVRHVDGSVELVHPDGSSVAVGANGWVETDASGVRHEHIEHFHPGMEPARAWNSHDGQPSDAWALRSVYPGADAVTIQHENGVLDWYHHGQLVDRDWPDGMSMSYTWVDNHTHCVGAYFNDGQGGEGHGVSIPASADGTVYDQTGGPGLSSHDFASGHESVWPFGTDAHTSHDGALPAFPEGGRIVVTWSDHVYLFDGPHHAMAYGPQGEQEYSGPAADHLIDQLRSAHRAHAT